MPAPATTTPPQAAPDKLSGEIRVGSHGKAYDQSLILSDKQPFGPRRILRGALDVILAVSLPTLLMLLFGIWQMAMPDKVRSADTPVMYRLRFAQVMLRTADGYGLSAWDVPSAVPSEDAIVVLSGYAADKGSILPRTAFLGQEHRLLYLDFRSFGGSSGRYSTMGVREVEDALAGVHYLKDQGVKRIGVYGFTMGGAVALMAAARDPDVTAVVTEDAYSDFDAVIAQPYAYLGPAKPVFARVAKAAVQTALRVNVDAISPAAVAGELKIPVLVIHSRADASVPMRHAELLKERMSSNRDAQFWYTDGKTDIDSRTAFAQAVSAFFRTHLSATATVAP